MGDAQESPGNFTDAPIARVDGEHIARTEHSVRSAKPPEGVGVVENIN